MMKKIFLILVLVTFLALLFNSFCFAQRELEIEYPTVPGVETPVTTKTALPEYLRYIFTFAIIVAGLLAFGALIYGGIRYLTSAGDPTKMADARAQVTAGILGLIILLSSYLILNTINPQLVLPKKPPIMPGKAGIKIYSNSIDCGENPITGKEMTDIESMKIINNIEKLKDPDIYLDWGTDGENKIRSIKFLGNPGDLTIKIYKKNLFDKLAQEIDYPEGDTESCKPFNGAVTAHRSIELIWHLPGVYLYASNNCTGDDYKIYQSGSATLPEFDNKTNSIKFRYGFRPIEISKDTPIEERNRIWERECTGQGGEINPVPMGERDDNYLYQCFTQKYAAILHEKESYMGTGVVAEPVENDDCINLNWLIKLNDPSNNKGVDLTDKVSSITVYLKPPLKNGQLQIVGQGVRFWEDKNYGKKYLGDDENGDGYYGDNEFEKNLNTDLWVIERKIIDSETVDQPPVKEKFNNKVTSIEIDGHYVALLFEDKDYGGKCEVFMSSDPDLRNNPLGQCGFLGRFDCLSSFIIKARK